MITRQSVKTSDVLITQPPFRKIRGRRSCPLKWGITAYTYMATPGSFWEPGIFYQRWRILSNNIIENRRIEDDIANNNELTMRM